MYRGGCGVSALRGFENFRCGRFVVKVVRRHEHSTRFAHSIFAHSGAMFCYHSPRVYHSNFSGARNFRLQKLVGKVEDKSPHSTRQFSQKQSRVESSFEFSVLLCLSTCPSQHDHDISQTLHSPTVPSYASVFPLQEIRRTITRRSND